MQHHHQTARLTFAAALAVVSIRIIENAIGVHLNGQTAEVTGAFTVLWEGLLRLLGVLPTDAGENPTPPA